MWSIRDWDDWSDELKTIVSIVTGGQIHGKPIKEDEEDENLSQEARKD